VEYVELQGLGSVDSSHVFAEAPTPDDDNDQPSGFWHSLPEITAVEPILPRLAHLDGKNLVPAQIAYLPAGLADLFILTEIPR
jgi:hypothetical protein